MNMEHIHILVADDEEPMRQALTFILESAGHTVTAVDDGGYALQQLITPPVDSNGYDLLITDLMMPRLPGIDLISILNQRNISMPVIVISGCSDKKTMIQLIRNGCNDFLEKPFTPEDVLDRVDEVLHKWQQTKQRQQEREEQLQHKLDHMRRLLQTYEKRLTGSMEIEDVRNSSITSAVNLLDFPADSLGDYPETTESAGRWNSQGMADIAEKLHDPDAVTSTTGPALIEVVRDGEWLSLTPQAYLDDEYTPEFCKLLVAYLDAGEHHFRFNLSRISEVGSRVLAVFAAFAAILRQRGEESALEISDCTRDVAQLFRLTSLDRMYRLPALISEGK